MAASVQVLCPNGRRQYVKITPNTKIIQIIEEVCLKQGYAANDYELKHGRVVLDVTVAFRYTNLANNAKLELVKAEKKRQLGRAVTVALQLDSNERLQRDCAPSMLLWDVLKAYELDVSSSGAASGSVIQLACTKTSAEGKTLHPVCVYMGEEVVGQHALEATALSSLGLLSGRAVIRVTHRCVDEALLEEIATKIQLAHSKRQKLETLAQTSQCMTPVGNGSGNARNALDSSFDKTGNVVQPNHDATGSAAQGECTSSAAPMDEGNTTDESEQSVAQVDRIDESAAPLVTEELSTSQLLPSCGLSTIVVSEEYPMPRRDISLTQHDTALSSTPTTATCMSSIAPLHAFAPSGSSGAHTHLSSHHLPFTQTQEIPNDHWQKNRTGTGFADFKFPEESKGQDLYRNELSTASKDDFRPCERETIVYCANDDSIDGDKQEADAELTDDFFEVTVEDVKKMMNDLKRQMSLEDEKPLLTQAQRDALADERMSRYQCTIIRFHFADKTVVQAKFRPKETVYALQKFIEKQLLNRKASFYLYTAPPKCVLQDNSMTLIQANLTPMSIVYVGTEDVSEDLHLSEEAMMLKQDRMRADRSVYSSLPQRLSASDRAPSSPAVTAEATLSTRQPAFARSLPSASQQQPAGETKHPKWYKPGR